MSVSLRRRWGEEWSVDAAAGFQQDLEELLTTELGPKTMLSKLKAANGVCAFSSLVLGALQMSGRVLRFQGPDVASANNLTLGSGNRFQVTGTTQINLLDGTSWQAGSEVTLMFTGSLTVKHNQTTIGAFFPIMLSGAVDFSATANDQLTLQLNSDSKWYEKCRTVI